MEFTIIRSPEKGVVEIILERANTKMSKEEISMDTIGLIQGRVIDMILAADIAEKVANVRVCDIRGSCPQNMTVLGIFGDTTSVETAIKAIKETMSSRKEKF